MRKLIALILICTGIMLHAHIGAAGQFRIGRALQGAVEQVVGAAISPTPPVQYQQSYSQPTQPYSQPTTEPYSTHYQSDPTVASDPYAAYYQSQTEPGESETTKAIDNGSGGDLAGQESFDPNNPFAGMFDDGGGSESAKDDGKNDTIEVVATGIGRDSDGALKNALRAAIEQAVGTLVDSETLAQNDEVVNDQILSYSAGFVESHKVIGEPKTVDGLVTIKIVAQVKQTQLTKKLQSVNIHIKEVDGESLFGEAITKMEQKASATEVALKAFEGFPESYIDAKMTGKPQYDDAENIIILEIEVSTKIDALKQFCKNLSNTIKTISNDHARLNFQNNVRNNSVTIGRTMNGWQGQDYDEWMSKNALLIYESINEMRTNATVNAYTLPSDAYRRLVELLKKHPILSISIVDSNNEIIVSGNYDTPVPYVSKTPGWQDNPINPIIISPLLDNNSGEQLYFSPGKTAMTLKVSFKTTPNEMKRMRNVVCKIEKRR